MANQFDLDRFDDCPTKRWLQSQIYSSVARRMKSNAMIVSGPSVERHITDGFRIASTPKAKIYLVERNIERFYEMSRRCQAIKNSEPLDGWPEDWYSRVTRLHTDVISYERLIKSKTPTRFEDLDMCQTMPSIQYLIGHRLLLQSKLAGSAAKLRKCILITSSLRHCELDKTLDILFTLVKDILGAKVSLWHGAKGAKHSRLYREHGVKEYSPYMEDHGRILNNGLRFYTYRDGAPMFSCMILYI